MLVEKNNKKGLTRIKSVCLNNWKVLGMKRLTTFREDQIIYVVGVENIFDVHRNNLATGKNIFVAGRRYISENRYL